MEKTATEKPKTQWQSTKTVETVDLAVTWSENEFTTDEVATFDYTSTFSDTKYTLAEGVEMPTITVNVVEENSNEKSDSVSGNNYAMAMVMSAGAPVSGTEVTAGGFKLTCSESLSDLQSVVITAINKTLGGRDTFLSVLKANIEMVLSDDTTPAMTDINIKLENLQTELLNRVNSKADYEDIADEIDTLREEKQSVLLQQAEREGVKQRIEDMMVFLDEQPSELESYDDNLTRRLIQKIMVYEDKYTVEFKSGVAIEVTM